MSSLYTPDPQGFFQWLWGGVATLFALLIGTIWRTNERRHQKTEERLVDHEKQDHADLERIHEKIEGLGTELRGSIESHALEAAHRQADLMNVMLDVRGRIK